MAGGNHDIAPVRMDQAMSVAAVMVIATVNTFCKPEDDDKTKRDISWAALAVFLHQLLMASKHKDIAVGVLEALIVELKDAKPSQPPV